MFYEQFVYICDEGRTILRQKHQTSAMHTDHLPKLEGAQRFGCPSTECGHIIFIQVGCDLNTLILGSQVVFGPRKCVAN
jgi:hypothetical protein